ncbi:astacin-like metalloendopeptidase [Cheilinus undulatus]|uniref:astacin-like metalloendopeptidase n=1 Tax=Cheilinus undulatus TaxID=241271 RepID=UPI001BD288C2|nr:astacin-like metalloendopeptidase [Cheilinus undulatus]
MTSEIMLHVLLSALLFAQLMGNADCGPIKEAKKALQEDWIMRALHYMERNPETLNELMSQDYTLTEGDIVLSADRNAVESVWMTREIPYLITEDLASRTEDILSAMAMLSEHTCVKFHNRTSETNYLIFKPSKGCASYVGFIGGEQPVFVGPPCTVGNIVHEILHALGFHHEHTREDREKYITVLNHNIMEGMERNFEKKPGETFGLPYDIISIMHYGREFFSSNGLPTIVPKGDVMEMGQRVKLTDMDIQRVRHLYSCDFPENTLEIESSEVVQQEDAHWSRFIYSDEISADKTEENHKTATTRPSAAMQQQTAASRGCKNTS